MKKKPTLLAVASNGGHWVQLGKITQELEDEFLVLYISTSSKSEVSVIKQIPDFSGINVRSFLYFIKTAFQSALLIRHYRPNAVISTGALPGLAFTLAARLLNVKSIWVDSIANVNELSLSGKVARFTCTKTYTQWPHLADKNVFYRGRVL